jgi:hypothetical protein
VRYLVRLSAAQVLGEGEKLRESEPAEEQVPKQSALQHLLRQGGAGPFTQPAEPTRGVGVACCHRRRRPGWRSDRVDQVLCSDELRAVGHLVVLAELREDHDGLENEREGQDEDGEVGHLERQHGLAVGVDVRHLLEQLEAKTQQAEHHELSIGFSEHVLVLVVPG